MYTQEKWPTFSHNQLNSIVNCICIHSIHNKQDSEWDACVKEPARAGLVHRTHVVSFEMQSWLTNLPPCWATTTRVVIAAAGALYTASQHSLTVITLSLYHSLITLSVSMYLSLSFCLWFWHSHSLRKNNCLLFFFFFHVSLLFLSFCFSHLHISLFLSPPSLSLSLILSLFHILYSLIFPTFYSWNYSLFVRPWLLLLLSLIVFLSGTLVFIFFIYLSVVICFIFLFSLSLLSLLLSNQSLSPPSPPLSWLYIYFLFFI